MAKEIVKLEPWREVSRLRREMDRSGDDEANSKQEVAAHEQSKSWREQRCGDRRDHTLEGEIWRDELSYSLVDYSGYSQYEV